MIRGLRENWKELCSQSLLCNTVSLYLLKDVSYLVILILWESQQCYIFFMLYLLSLLKLQFWCSCLKGSGRSTDNHFYCAGKISSEFSNFHPDLLIWYRYNLWLWLKNHKKGSGSIKHSRPIIPKWPLPEKAFGAEVVCSASQKLDDIY